MLVWDEVSFLKSDPSPEEKREFYRKRAEAALKYLRNNTYMYNTYMNELRAALRNGGLSMSDVGTSEVEVKNFKPGI